MTTVGYHIQVDTRSGQASLERLDNKFEKVGRSARETETKVDRFSGVVKKAGAAITAAFSTAAVAAFATKSINAFGNYESALQDMRKVTDESLSSIDKKIKALDASLGSYTELVKGYYQIISAGVTDPVKAMDTLVVASKAAKVAHVDQAETIKVLTKVMAGYEGEIKNAAQSAELLLGIEKAGQTSFMELVPVLGDVAAVAKSVNIQYQEMGGALSLITKVSGSTSEASTKLRAIVQSFIKPQKELTEAIENAGYESARAMIKELGFVEALEQLQTQAEKTGKPLGDLFSRAEAITGVNILAANSFETLKENIGIVESATGTLDKRWQEYIETWEAISSKFKSTWQNIFIEFGKELKSPLSEALDNFSTWAKDNKQEIIDIAKGFGEIAKAIGSIGAGLIKYFTPLAKFINEAARMTRQGFETLGNIEHTDAMWRDRALERYARQRADEGHTKPLDKWDLLSTRYQFEGMREQDGTYTMGFQDLKNYNKYLQQAINAARLEEPEVEVKPKLKEGSMDQVKEEIRSSSQKAPAEMEIEPKLPKYAPGALEIDNKPIKYKDGNLPYYGSAGVIGVDVGPIKLPGSEEELEIIKELNEEYINQGYIIAQNEKTMDESNQKKIDQYEKEKVLLAEIGAIIVSNTSAQQKWAAAGTAIGGAVGSAYGPAGQIIGSAVGGAIGSGLGRGMEGKHYERPDILVRADELAEAFQALKASMEEFNKSLQVQSASPTEKLGVIEKTMGTISSLESQRASLQQWVRDFFAQFPNIDNADDMYDSPYWMINHRDDVKEYEAVMRRINSLTSQINSQYKDVLPYLQSLISAGASAMQGAGDAIEARDERIFKKKQESWDSAAWGKHVDKLIGDTQSAKTKLDTALSEVSKYTEGSKEYEIARAKAAIAQMEYAETIEALIEAEKEYLSVLEKAVDANEALIESVQATRNSLLESRHNPDQSFHWAKRHYENLLASVEHATNQDEREKAIREYQAYLSTFLDKAMAYYGNSAEYEKIFNSIIDTDLPSIEEELVKVNTQLKDAVKSLEKTISSTLNSSGGYADGGVSDGSMSGHWELLHGKEAVIPLKKGAVPVVIKDTGTSGRQFGYSGNQETNKLLQDLILAVREGRIVNIDIDGGQFDGRIRRIADMNRVNADNKGMTGRRMEF